jgi:hypothetical protein
MKIEPFLIRHHPAGEGVQRLYRFANGYGVSAVTDKLPHCSDIDFGDVIGTTYASYTNTKDEWEVAVIRFSGIGYSYGKFVLDHTTEIANDVIPNVTEDRLQEILAEVMNLPNANSLTAKLSRLFSKRR